MIYLDLKKYEKMLKSSYKRLYINKPRSDKTTNNLSHSDIKLSMQIVFFTALTTFLIFNFKLGVLIKSIEFL